MTILGTSFARTGRASRLPVAWTIGFPLSQRPAEMGGAINVAAHCGPGGSSQGLGRAKLSRSSDLDKHGNAAASDARLVADAVVQGRCIAKQLKTRRRNRNRMTGAFFLRCRRSPRTRSSAAVLQSRD